MTRMATSSTRTKGWSAFIKSPGKGDEFKVGGIGFFDSPNSQEYANLLFDSARKWLAEKGVEAMDGPINFGERNTWWGLLVEGFHAPLYGMNYNPPYYQTLFEENKNNLELQAEES